MKELYREVLLGDACDLSYEMQKLLLDDCVMARGSSTPRRGEGEVRKPSSAWPSIQPYRRIKHKGAPVNFKVVPDVMDPEFVGCEINWRGVHDGTIVGAGELAALDDSEQVEIGIEVIRKGLCLLLAINEQRKDSDIAPIDASINLSQAMLMQRGFGKRLLDVLNEDGFEKNLLIAEILETVDIDAENVMVNLDELAKGGVKLSLDDFGLANSMKTGDRFKKEKRKVYEVKFDGNFTEQVVDESSWPLLDGLLIEAERLGAERLVWEGLPSGLTQLHIDALERYHKVSRVGRKWKGKVFFEGGIVEPI